MRPCRSVLAGGLADHRCVVWRFPDGYGGKLFDPLEEAYEQPLDPGDAECPLVEWYGDVVVMQATGRAARCSRATSSSVRPVTARGAAS
jgi:hypothetical protein